MRALSSAFLYGIVDLGYVRPDAAAAMTRSLIAGGVDILQLRAKGRGVDEVRELGKVLHEITLAAGVPLVVNDYPAAARDIGCEGVHVGQEDDAVARARDVVGGGCMVGKSTHSLAQAVAAQAEGADYIGFGPLFATGTKPDYTPIGLGDVAEVHGLVQVPIFCIGGVNGLRLDDVLAAGARRVVVVSAFLCAPDPAAEVAALKSRLLRK
jgi:thiamine-phosphate pyrophosphorylase